MLLSVFSGLVVLAVFFIVLGYSVRESSYNVIGFVFLFVLAVFQGGALGTGSVEVLSYSDSITSFSYDNNSVLMNQSETLTPVYSNIADDDSDKGFQWFMRWLAIISGVGLLVSIVEIRNYRRRSD